MKARLDARITLADLDRIYPAACWRQKEDAVVGRSAPARRPPCCRARPLRLPRSLWGHFVKVSRVAPGARARTPWASTSTSGRARATSTT
ncbi:hypothetical protein ACRAWD_12950 [Caulobacter segnis]